MLSDLEIAQKADIKPVTEIAKKLNLNEDDWNYMVNIRLRLMLKV